MNKKLLCRNHSLRLGLASSFVVLMSSLATQAMAQDESQVKSDLLEEQVIVTGTKMNLKNAQDIKREADTVVDALSAEDIGSLPDRSVLEAIQRLPGVSVERFAGPDDPDHFSVEGSGAIIRGMTQTRSEFNGRDSFTANSGRGLNFQDVSPELMQGVDIYKNQTADMIEGGIGGSISLRTRKPFDQDGRQVAFNIDYSYGDLAEEWSPTYSGLFSDRWDTGIGEFGFLVSFANSELYGESHGIQSDAYVRYEADLIPGGERFQDAVAPDETAYVWMPNSANALIKEDDRKRQGISTAVQWANPSETLEVTGEYFRSDSSLGWHENAIKYQGSYPENTTDVRSTAREGQTIEFNDQGLFQGGELRYLNWLTSGQNSDHVIGDARNSSYEFGQKMQFDTRLVDTDNLVEDYSLKGVWRPTDNFELSADYQYVKAKTEEDDLVIHTGSFAGQKYYLGDTPELTLVDPWFGYRDAHPDEFAPGSDYTAGFSTNTNTEYSAPGDADYFQDYNNYFWRSAMEHYERSEGELAAGRIDGTVFFDDIFLTAVKFGVRYADREQLVHRTSWNWKSVGPEWSGSTPAAWVLDEAYAPQLGDLEYVDWSNFHRGGVVNVPGNKTLHATESFVRAVRDFRRELISSSGGEWNNVGTADDPNQGRYANRYGVDDRYGLFWPGEISYTREQNQAFYTRLDFANDGALRYSGNIGFRYVKLKRQADGSVVYPNLAPARYPPATVSLPLTNESVMAEMQRQVDEGIFADIEAALEGNPWVDEPESYLSDADRAFGNGAALPTRAEKDFELFLPSLNLKVEMTDDLIARFAVAKAAAYPDISEVRNRINIGLLNYQIGEERYQDLPELEDGSADPREGMIERTYVRGWTGSGGNPTLEPMMSTQYDIALEWYFSDVGQLSGTIFHKNLSNYFIKGASYQVITNPLSGESRPVDVEATVNGGKAKMDGFELAYQQFFEGMFDGFGVQATYTYIDASGVPNTAYDANELEAWEDEQRDLDPDGQADWIGDNANDPGLRVSLATIPLQGQSKETVNLIGMYEKYGWNARLAYNWRSKYLLTTRDVISKVPLWNDNYGQLDGSLFYDINDYFTVGMQMTNILDSQTKTIMMLNDEGMTAGRSWFVADRRVAFVVKGNF
ncbi:TonB-dependent receptor [Alteromonadaceae bacterium 2753L.S.0a.02]|nr:TonB-dependent receptor [Alteromonadaceae bacterium 2753L.S.0a.02]